MITRVQLLRDHLVSAQSFYFMCCSKKKGGWSTLESSNGHEWVFCICRHRHRLPGLLLQECVNRIQSVLKRRTGSEDTALEFPEDDRRIYFCESTVLIAF